MASQCTTKILVKLLMKLVLIKTVNTATVHNELILDDKYILVGRGLYALKEWGFSKVQ